MKWSTIVNNLFLCRWLPHFMSPAVVYHCCVTGYRVPFLCRWLPRAFTFIFRSYSSYSCRLFGFSKCKLSTYLYNSLHSSLAWPVWFVLNASLTSLVLLEQIYLRSRSSHSSHPVINAISPTFLTTAYTNRMTPFSTIRISRSDCPAQTSMFGLMNDIFLIDNFYTLTMCLVFSLFCPAENTKQNPVHAWDRTHCFSKKCPIKYSMIMVRALFFDRDQK